MCLFLSPHLDDAALSCGGTIFTLAQAGADVAVLTLMAGDPPDPPPDTPIVRDLHARWAAGDQPVAARRREDARACAVLGARAQHAPLPDCVYRVGLDGAPLYPDQAALWGGVRRHDPASAALQALTLPPAQAVYAPLGVGAHVDHLIVRDWALALARAGRTVIFYEDFPYARDCGALARALAAFDRGALASQTRPLAAAAVRARLAAVACYDSQLSTFWPSRAAMERDLLAYMLAVGAGAPAERFWSYSGGQSP
ncbi:MAG: PIG-L deacetylase family protein [Aggregatilineales bacterium]